jgi:hypothetical protein
VELVVAVALEAVEALLVPQVALVLLQAEQVVVQVAVAVEQLVL